MIHWTPEGNTSESHNLVGEAPLSIRVQGKPFSTGMRTPGDEAAHAAGFCLAQGIVTTPDQIVSVDYDSAVPDQVDITLTDKQWSEISDNSRPRGLEGGTGFGQRAEDVIDALCRVFPPFPDGMEMDVKQAFQCLDDLHRHQPLRRATRATHATAIYTPSLELLAAAEDVGRHNGLDKAIGRLFLDRKLDRAGLLALSSRISFELVQKAVRARIPVIFAVSRPTALAVELATRLNMTLACLARDGGGYIFCGRKRLRM